MLSDTIYEAIELTLKGVHEYPDFAQAHRDNIIQALTEMYYTAHTLWRIEPMDKNGIMLDAIMHFENALQVGWEFCEDEICPRCT